MPSPRFRYKIHAHLNRFFFFFFYKKGKSLIDPDYDLCALVRLAGEIASDDNQPNLIIHYMITVYVPQLLNV